MFLFLGRGEALPTIPRKYWRLFSMHLAGGSDQRMPMIIACRFDLAELEQESYRILYFHNTLVASVILQRRKL